MKNSKQTTLDLNGPILSFIQQPEPITVCAGSAATFTGIATATFLTIGDVENPASNTGSISYQWYAEGFGVLSDGSFRGAVITGSATTTLTLTIANTPTAELNQSKFYVAVDYIPSAYSQPDGSSVTAGTARSTGNAINEILNSNISTLTISPSISIVDQPDDQIVSQDSVANFSTYGEFTQISTEFISYNWQLNGIDLSDNATVVGSSTTTLSISLPNISENSIRARLSYPTACNSPIFTNTVNFSVVAPRPIIKFESITSSSTEAFLSSWNLSIQGEITIDSSSFNNFNLLSFYAPEKDIIVEMDIYARKGIDRGGYVGGEGGYSRIRFTMKKNEEFVLNQMLTLGEFNEFQIQEAGQFLYRKGRLIAALGAGGNAGTGGNGGPGGGVNIAGGSGTGRNAGTGGVFYSPGTLPSTGLFGSSSIYSPKATAPLGGRTVPCPKGGSYYISRGFAPCDDLGIIPLTLSTGQTYTNTASITRGFKSGGGVRQTSGLGLNGGGNGGAGATGGNGGSDGGGGGGGSGYTDGSITIVSTQQGGNTGNPRAILRLIS